MITNMMFMTNIYIYIEKILLNGCNLLNNDIVRIIN